MIRASVFEDKWKPIHLLVLGKQIDQSKRNQTPIHKIEKEKFEEGWYIQAADSAELVEICELILMQPLQTNN